jgi:phytanoyl-CoA hydroxylase
MEDLTQEQWESFLSDGFVIVPGVLAPGELSALNARLDALMNGTVNHGDALLMQLDPSASSSAAPSAEYAAYSAANVEVSGQTRGFKGASRAYRKIGEAECGLECDDVFMATMRRALFRRACDRVYGAHAGVAVYRSMVMSKPAGPDGGGSTLPWHQDGGEWWALDRDPLLFVWMALSDATRANGAVQVVRGSHKLGLLSRRGHTLSEADIARVVDGGEVVDVELRAGDAFFCHKCVAFRGRRAAPLPPSPPLNQLPLPSAANAAGRCTAAAQTPRIARGGASRSTMSIAARACWTPSRRLQGRWEHPAGPFRLYGPRRLRKPRGNKRKIKKMRDAYLHQERVEGFARRRGREGARGRRALARALDGGRARGRRRGRGRGRGERGRGRRLPAA